MCVLVFVCPLVATKYTIAAQIRVCHKLSQICGDFGNFLIWSVSQQ